MKFFGWSWWYIRMKHNWFYNQIFFSFHTKFIKLHIVFFDINKVASIGFISIARQNEPNVEFNVPKHAVIWWHIYTSLNCVSIGPSNGLSSFSHCLSRWWIIVNWTLGTHLSEIQRKCHDDCSGKRSWKYRLQNFGYFTPVFMFQE